MDTQTMGECLVCGTETKNRCSACAKAGVDLFFCSPEHQKLAWHMHRMFCGPGKANPFRWPPLTPKEAEAATRILDLPINTVMPHSATLFQELQVVVHCPRSEMPLRSSPLGLLSPIVSLMKHSCVPVASPSRTLSAFTPADVPASPTRKPSSHCTGAPVRAQPAARYDGRHRVSYATRRGISS
ncbi:RHTO0S21e01200g1_1 [Rhodotorula toruloides]|uniref:RHTO0S21e01200g1_1 n=1 Tax=Rhodotorula toruloides TaxID=5286 RepID=A0A061BLQ5_RHOTO|nr:RHTO0S21e01200g1_1 [Rhodotorula toruloides]